MKRILFIILPLLLISASLVCGCAGAHDEPDTSPVPDDIAGAEICESSHDREEGYMAAFSTHMLSTGRFTLHMANAVYDEAALREAAEVLSADLTVLEATAGTTPDAVTVYAVSATITGCPQTVGTEVFCSPDDIKSGAYRDALCGAAYALPCAWQHAGLSELAFGDGADANLRNYYADNAHPLTASCSAIHLSPVFSDEGTVAAARATARSICAFLLGSGDFSAFREAADPAPVLPSWAESMGISPAPVLPEGSAAAAELRLGIKSGSICELKVGNFTVTVSKNSWVTDPDELYSWFCRFFAGMDMVLERIGAEVPSVLPLVLERYSEPILINMGDPSNATYAYPSQNKIDLTKDNAIWHEMVHLLLEEKTLRTDQAWIEEGAAEHFSFAAQSRLSPTRYYSEGFDAYLDFFEEVSGKEPEADDMLFHRQVRALYLAFRRDTDSDDNEAYCRAYGIVSLLSGGKLRRTQVRMLYDVSIAAKRGEKPGSKKADGSALTYPEAVVVYDRLCARFGTEAVLENFLNGRSLKDAFGITYTELYQDVLVCCAEEYGALMPDA